MTNTRIQPQQTTPLHQLKPDERGAALLLSLIILILVAGISVIVLTVVTHESRIAGSDLKRTEAFYATASGIEKMTNDFAGLFQRTANPVQSQLNTIANSPPPELLAQGFTFNQTLVPDDVTLTSMRLTQNITNGAYPHVNIKSGPLNGLFAAVSPYILTSTGTHTRTGAKVTLQRNVNNYLIPLFQFGTFSDGDLEFWPQPPMTFNGRVHANGNIYFGGDITFTKMVTTANEAVRTVLRNNKVLPAGYSVGNPRFLINGTTAAMTMGSVIGGPNLPQPRTDQRGVFTDSPNGTDNTSWAGTSIAKLDGTPNQFGGLLQTKSTGTLPLQLPLQIDGNKPLEIIKRAMPGDTNSLSTGRFHNKAEIRIFIDDEVAGSGVANVAGIPGNLGVFLSQFDPVPLNGGNALRVVKDDGTGYQDNLDWLQGDPALGKKADTVRGVRSYTITTASAASATTGGKNATLTELNNSNIAGNVNKNIPKLCPTCAFIPPGAGITGHILIQIRTPDGNLLDVTQTILSMGMTVGEPNGIVYLQRPEWAAHMQGGRDRKGDLTHHNFLTYFLDTSVTDRRCIADGEVRQSVVFSNIGYINATDTTLDDDTPTGALTPCMPNNATRSRDDQFSTASGSRNRIVPINLYNVREGRIDEALSTTTVYSRGIGSVIDINMRNLARWVDGVFDNTLLSGTNAVSANIDGSDGYVVYISDRRGDRVKLERTAAGANINTTNGMVDNEDVYGYNQANGDVPDRGEDVIDFGFDPVTGKLKKNSLQMDTNELPDPVGIALPANLVAPALPAGVDPADFTRATVVSEWNPAAMAAPGALAPNYYFRRAVRLFNGENLQTSLAPNKLSPTKGIMMSTENMIYIWGNYNTTGINGQPLDGTSTLNDPTQPFWYTGNQIPAGIVADAFFPLSKTWYDAMSSMYPEGGTTRIADADASATGTGAILIGQETSVRAGIISGTTLSSMPLNPTTYFLEKMNGGVHNFPRFMETWDPGVEKRWNYTGSFILLYNSTQAVGPYSVASSVVYAPPKRNWSFDDTFLDPRKLPPGTPEFQFIEPTAFRQIF